MSEFQQKESFIYMKKDDELEVSQVGLRTQHLLAKLSASQWIQHSDLGFVVFQHNRLE